MDIRNFFGAKAKPGSKPVVAPKKETEQKKKRANVISDSDSDEDFSQPKDKKMTKITSPPKEVTKSTPKPELKEVSATDFFKTSNSSKPVKTTTPSKKRKESLGQEDRDKAFNKTLEDTEFRDQQTKKQRTMSPDKSSDQKTSVPDKSSSDHTPSSKKSKPDTSSLAGKLSASLMNSSKKKEIPETESFTMTSQEKKGKPSPDKLLKSPNKQTTPLAKSTDLNESVSEVPGTPQEAWEEKKKERQATYKKFLSRGGAKNPGSKDIPEGSPNCLKDLVFVLTGVFKSLEREEMGEIVKKLGGKVTTSLSKNTKYMVVGEEAGQSKLEKAKSLGTKQLTEDEFLDLIREKTVKEKENKTPKTSPDKNEAKETKSPKEQKPVVKSLQEDKKSTSTPPKISPKKEPKYNIPKIATPTADKVESKMIPKLPKPEKPLVVPDAVVGSGEVDLWVDKYKPSNLKGIIGQQGDRSNMNKLKIWLRDWSKNHLGGDKKASKPAPWGAANDNGAWAKCALLSGPPGVGKTTTAYLVSKELGFDIVEMNASDTRSKRLLGENVSDLLNTTSVANMVGDGKENEKVTSKRVLLMDEVDGMAGNEDRGGIAELILLMKSSKVPVIAMCNDRNHQKIRSLANHCYDLRFQRPRVEQIKAAMMSVCFKEKIQIKPEALTELISGCGQDVRQVLHHLAMVKASNSGIKMEADQAKKEAAMSKKTSIKVGPWDVCKQVFSAEEHKSMSLFDKSDLYFHDYNMAGLFVSENYLAAKPAAAGGDKKKLMRLVSKAADSIAEGDLVERGIRSGMNWSLLPTAAMFCSVLPGEYMSGFMTGQVQFPSWLGKNSSRNKVDRIMGELQSHTRLSAGVSKQSFIMDYGQVLRNHLVSPLVGGEAAEGVDTAVQRMGDYSLLREDLDGLIEATQWPNRPDPLKNVDSKTKAAFTRKYNKEGASLPYAVMQAVNKRKGISNNEEGLDGEVEEEEEQPDDDKIENDGMIKKKQKSTKAEPKAGSSKPAAGKGKGKGKK